MLQKSATRAGVLGIVVVGIIGVGTLALAFGTLGNRLQAPFHLAPAGSLTGFSLTETPASFLDETKDTDQDGLTDASELQVYHTSPFLSDSDSDGVRDGEELQKGTDPNCPEGKDCRANLFPSQKEMEEKNLSRTLYESTALSKLHDAGGTLGVVGSGLVPDRGGAQGPTLQKNSGGVPVVGEQATQAGPALQNSLPQNPTADTIRKLLVAAGMDKELLKKFTDEQLVKLYKETLTETNKNPK